MATDNNTSKQTRVSKFFIETSPYHDNGELILQLFNDAQSAIDYAKEHVSEEGFNIYEIGESELSMYDSFIKPDRDSLFLNSIEYHVYSLNKSRQRSIDRGDIQGWNEHVIKHNLGEEYLIKWR